MPITSSIQIKHKKVSAVADAGDSSLVQPSDWNDQHKLEGWGAISSNLTLTVGSTGCDYTTVSAALADLAMYAIAPSATVTVEIQDQTVVESATINVRSPFMQNVLVKGKSSATKSLTNIVGPSGSAGGWSLPLSLTDASGIAVGDYIFIPPTATGGTNPMLAAGVHKVTAVDMANSQVTVLSKSRYTSAPSGAITGTVTVYKSVIDFTTANVAGLSIYSGLKLQDVVVAGGSSGGGIEANQGSISVPSGKLLTSGFATGAVTSRGGLLEGALVVSGATGNGVSAGSASNFVASGLVCTGNGGNGLSSSGSSYATTPSSYIIANGASGILSTTGATIAYANSTLAFNALYAGYASDAGNLIGTAITLANNGLGFSPAQGSSGNNGGFIGTN